MVCYAGTVEACSFDRLIKEQQVSCAKRKISENFGTL